MVARVQQCEGEPHSGGGYSDDQQPLHSAGDSERTQPAQHNVLK